MNALGRTSLRPVAARPAAGAWIAALGALGLGLLALGHLFAVEIVAAIEVWNGSSAYNHCWLILPIAGWLAWVRRHRLLGLAPAPAPALAWLAVPPALAWLAAERLGIMEGRQLAALALAEVCILAVLGWRICRAMAVPLTYLVFLVPFGGFAVPVLQRTTAWLIEFGLGLADIPHYVDGLVIQTPAGDFYVAEACAGLRFIIAALAFGALYASVTFRSPGRRLAVLGLAVLVPVLANGVRALGIVVLGHYLGSAEAAAADHLVYGWGFFSAVILLLILAGLPFREDGVAAEGPSMPLASPPAPLRRVILAAGLAGALAAAGPLAAAGLDRGAGPPQEVALPPLLAPEGCAAVAEGLRCDGMTLSARLLVFPGRATWAAVTAARHQANAGGSDEDNGYALALPDRALWQVRHFADRSGVTATAVWLQGRPAGDGLRSRAAQAWNALRGGMDGAPVLAVVRLQPHHGTPPGPARERALLQAVLEAQAEGLAAYAAALSAGHRAGAP